VPYQIHLDAGLHSGGVFHPRRMGLAAATLSYNLYRESTRTEVWGDGSNSTSVITGTGTTTHTLYGRVSALQTPAAGEYTDAVVVTVIW